MVEVIAGRYRLGDPIGAGGMAHVVEGHDDRLDRRVAIKLVPTQAIDPVVRERFRREARTSAHFTHPNAVATYDAGEADGHLFLVMELVDGPSLARRLAVEGPLDVDESVRIADAVLAALQAAHAAGIVHRDVKPANVLLGRDRNVKLADFGIAKRLDDFSSELTGTGHFVGTPKYLAPEQLSGEAINGCDGPVLDRGRALRDGGRLCAVRRRRTVGHGGGSPDGARSGSWRHSSRCAGTRRRRRVQGNGEGSGRSLPDRCGDARGPCFSSPESRSRPACPPHRHLVDGAGGAAPRRRRVGDRLRSRRRRSVVDPVIDAVSSTAPPSAATAVVPPVTVTPSTASPTLTPTRAPAVIPPTTAASVAPQTVEELIALLDGNPGQFGERTDQLHRDLERIADERGNDPRRASRLLEDARRWVQAGELAPEVLPLLERLIGPLTAGDEGGGDEDD